MKIARKNLTNYLTVVDGDKMKIYSLKDFSSKYDSYEQFDKNYSKSIYFADDIFVEGLDYLKLRVGQFRICFLSWQDLLLAGTQAQVLRKDGVQDDKIIELLEVLYP